MGREVAGSYLHQWGVDGVRVLRWVYQGWVILCWNEPGGGAEGGASL